jgi:signal transduction histidine kinase/HAMP domain-containing protein
MTIRRRVLGGLLVLIAMAIAQALLVVVVTRQLPGGAAGFEPVPILLFCTSTISTAVLAWLFVAVRRELLNPLARVTATATLVSRGDYASPLPEPATAGDLHELQQAVTRMARTLQMRDRETAAALADAHSLAHRMTSSQREAQASHGELMATLETSPAALMILNQTDGRVRLQNRAAVEIFGVEPRDPRLRPKYWSRFRIINKDGSVCKPPHWPSSRALRGEDVIGLELDVHHPDGRTFAILASSAPLRNDLGHLVGAVVAFQEISRLREIDRLKDEFISVVSHELRTPLTSIRGSVQLVLDDPAAVPGDENRQLLNIALSNCERLIRIINDILDVSKIEAGHVVVHPRPGALADLVGQARDGVAQMAKAARVSIVVALPADLPAVLADPDRIVQALVNLLSNAIKFAPRGTAVTVFADATADAVRVTIDDAGEGISAENLGRIFQKFQQVDSSASRRQGGTGLGLVITKAIVEQHGGTVTVASEVGRGTRFTVTLPRASQPQATLSPMLARENPSPGDAPARLVLVVDDNDEYRHVTCRQLKSAGYETMEARDGSTALELAKRVRPDVITVDLLMPVMDGWTLIEQLRADPELARTRVVVVSDAGDQQMTRIPAGVPVVAKTAGLDRFLGEIREAIGPRA